MNALKDIPNVPGFRFIGVTLEQERVPCIVDLDPETGLHCAYRESDHEPIFKQLYAWEGALRPSENSL